MCINLRKDIGNKFMELYKKRKLSFSINSFVLKNTGYKHQSVEVAEFHESPVENGN